MIYSCFQGKTVLLTGHTGFKGTWLSLWLLTLGANLIGLSLGTVSKPSIFEVTHISSHLDDRRIDVNDLEELRRTILELQPDFVFHLAAQPLVRLSYQDPLSTLTTNAIGSANLLESLRSLDKNVIVVMITSDKVYDNVEWVWGYKETDRLGGKDPYSASKAMAELVIRTYFNSYFSDPDCNLRLAVARAGNVIGGGDWALDRIVPDCVRAWSANRSVEIRNPNSTRPWQHVLDPISGYLALADSLFESSSCNGEAFNFGPFANQNHSVRHLIEAMALHWPSKEWFIKDSPLNLSAPEAGLLKLNCDKAAYHLKWTPKLCFSQTVKYTMDWYKEFYDNPDSCMFDFTASQISQYSKTLI